MDQPEIISQEAVDLTSEKEVKNSVHIGFKPYDQEESREKLRGTIALILVWTLVGTIAAMLVMVWVFIDKSAVIIQVFPIILSPLIAIVGTVTGFYFGTLSNKKND